MGPWALFADPGVDGGGEMGTGWVVAATALITALLAGLATLWRDWLKDRKDRRELEAGRVTAESESVRVTRQDAIAEWKEYADRLERRIDAADAEIKQSRERHESDYRAWAAKYSDCTAEAAGLKGDVRLLQSVVQRLQGLAKDEAPPVASPGLIIADIRGTVREFSPSLTPLLHWMPADVRGKNVSVLVPERLRERQAAGLKKVAETGQPPWTERSILTHALTREGEEVPVTITLSGWQTEKGDWLLSAQIQRRSPAEQPSGILKASGT
jgi:PAS domain S-box-containing protein